METKTIVSVIVQLIVAANEALMAFGVTQFEGVTADTVYMVVSTVVMVIAWAYGIWKNHNFTAAAYEAQGVLDQLKGNAENNIVAEDVEEGEDDEQDL